LLLLQSKIVVTFGLLLLDFNVRFQISDVLAGLLQLLSVDSKLLHLFRIPIAFVRLDTMLHFLLPDCSLHDKPFEGRLLDVLLAELSLHVLEEGAGANPNISHLDSGKMNTPSFCNFGDFFHDSFAESLTILDNFRNS